MEDNLLGYIAFCLLLAVTPGVDMAIVTKNTLTYSKKGGLVTVLGICTSLLFYSFLTASGLSILVKENVTLYVAIKYVGAGYLMYLGAQTLYRSFLKLKSPLEVEELHLQNVSYKKLYIQGLLTNLLNPKIIVLYLSIIPQFIAIESVGFVTLLSYTSINIIIGIIWLYFYVSMINIARKKLLIPKVRQSLEGITGVALIILGLKILLD